MKEGWIEEELDDFLDVVDGDGKDLGFISRADASRLHMHTQLIQTPERHLKDPYIRYHSQLIEERGLYKGNQELNDVQTVILSANLINRRELEGKISERRFEESMLVNNPEMYKLYREQQQREEENDVDSAGVEQRIPGSVEEFLAALSTFSEDPGESSDKEREHAEGWLSSFLTDQDLDEMQDD